MLENVEYALEFLIFNFLLDIRKHPRTPDITQIVTEGLMVKVYHLIYGLIGWGDFEN